MHSFYNGEIIVILLTCQWEKKKITFPTSMSLEVNPKYLTHGKNQ